MRGRLAGGEAPVDLGTLDMLACQAMSHAPSKRRDSYRGVNEPRNYVTTRSHKTRRFYGCPDALFLAKFRYGGPVSRMPIGRRGSTRRGPIDRNPQKWRQPKATIVA